MSHESDKLKNSIRRHRDKVAVKKQLRISKRSMRINPNEAKDLQQPHRMHKRSAMDCGNPGCYLCGNPRKSHKDKLTQQEKRMFQDIDKPNDRHSNGVKDDQEDLL